MPTSTVIVLVLTGVSSVLYLLMMALFAAAMNRWRRRPAEALERAPRVTILKPLAGHDDDLAENLASFLDLDYPEYEIVLGVASPSDPAFPAARALAQRDPSRVRVVITDADAAINPKVAQLLGLARRATGEILVISDSNVRVTPNYLVSLARELADPEVGLVTSIFAGTGERTIGAALENLQLGAWITPGVVVAAGSGRPVTIGKSMAMRRRDLVKLGGFARVAEVLAEDHVLGAIFLECGYRVATSFDAIENRNVTCSVRRTFERHTRWAKIRRSISPAGFAAEPLLCPAAVAGVGALLDRSSEAALAALCACAMQTVTALLVVRHLRGRSLPLRYAPLELVRTAAMLTCWAVACVSTSIRWRGHDFVLTRGTSIKPRSRSSWSRGRAAARI